MHVDVCSRLMRGTSSGKKQNANASHSRQAQRKRAVVGSVTEQIAANFLSANGLREVERIPVEWGIVRVEGRVVSAAPRRKAGVDIHALDPRDGRYVACEVKWTQDGSKGLAWSELQPHQRAKLDRVLAYHGIAMVVWVSPGETLAIPWPLAGWQDGAPLHLDRAREVSRELTLAWRRAI